MDANYRRLRNLLFFAYYAVAVVEGTILMQGRVDQAKAAIVYDAPGSSLLVRSAAAVNGSLHAALLDFASLLLVLAWGVLAFPLAVVLARSTSRALIGFGRAIGDWQRTRRRAATARARLRQMERLQAVAEADGHEQSVSFAVGQLVERMGLIDEWVRTLQSETEPTRRLRCLAGLADAVTAIAKGAADGTYPREALDHAHVRAHLRESIEALERAGLRSDPVFNHLRLAFGLRVR